MYVPVIKNQQAEFAAIAVLREAGCVNDEIIPLVEVTAETLRYETMVDPITKKVVTEKVQYNSGAKKGQFYNRKVKDYQKGHDDTLSDISQLLPNHPIFVDFFRCDLTKYKGADHSKCALVLRLNNSLDEYKTRIKSIAAYANLIPVITIRSGIANLSPDELAELISELRSMLDGRSLAVRVEDVEGYEAVLANELTENDYVLFDINEAPLKSKITEFDELSDVPIVACKVLICSPRRRDIKNGEFANGYKIDNGHIVQFRQHGFDGIGDYAGHCDRLRRGGMATKGHAIALVYDGRENAFSYFVHPNANLGMKGYCAISDEILGKRNELESHFGECITLQSIEERRKKGTPGNWSTWITHTITRYIQQLYIFRNEYRF